MIGVLAGLAKASLGFALLPVAVVLDVVIAIVTRQGSSYTEMGLLWIFGNIEEAAECMEEVTR